MIILSAREMTTRDYISSLIFDNVPTSMRLLSYLGPDYCTSLLFVLTISTKKFSDFCGLHLQL